MTPGRTISGIDPRGWVITGVPVARASTTARPNGSSKSMRWSSALGAAEQPVALRRADRAEVGDVDAVDEGFDVLAVVRGVLDDAGDDQREAGASGDLDRGMGALVGVDAAEEEQVAAPSRAEGERVDVDPVVDRRRIRQVGVPVGVADRDVVPDVVVGAVGRDDALGGEAVDGRDDGRGHEPAEGEGQEVELVADDVEPVGALEDGGDVQRLVDLGVDRRVLLVPGRAPRRAGGRRWWSPPWRTG